MLLGAIKLAGVIKVVFVAAVAFNELDGSEPDNSKRNGSDGVVELFDPFLLFDRGPLFCPKTRFATETCCAISFIPTSPISVVALALAARLSRIFLDSHRSVPGVGSLLGLRLRDRFDFSFCAARVAAQFAVLSVFVAVLEALAAVSLEIRSEFQPENPLDVHPDVQPDIRGLQDSSPPGSRYSSGQKCG